MKNNKTDPKKLYPQPPYPAEEQLPPGIESQMSPLPEYGKEIYKGSGKLVGKVAVITGGDSGIGRAVAVAFAREGADIVISYLSEDEDAEETVKVIKETGRKAVAIRGDIGEEAQCINIINQTIKNFGGLDILVNNAAFQRTHGSILELSSEELATTFRTNIYAMFYLCKAALPHINPGGSIINTTSIQAFTPASKLLAYATTKGAIVTFTRAFAQEAIKKGVRVNAVAPGPVWTPLIPSTLGKQATETFGKDSLFGRTAQPIEMAPIFVLLASPEGSYITGQVYGATGAGLP